MNKKCEPYSLLRYKLLLRYKSSGMWYWCH